MDILLDNLSWMILNIFLAFLGVAFGYLFFNFKNSFFSVPFFVLWLLFVPNTIYLLTDIKWFFEQFPKLGFLGQMVLFGQYFFIVVLGFITFLLGLHPFEKFLLKFKSRNTNIVLFLTNYLIAFGVILGRWQRLNSWDVFIQPQAVVESSLRIIYSQQYLIIVLLFGTLGNIIYFSLRKFLRKA